MSKVAARCARCGRPVEPGEHLCEQCREEAPVQVMGRTEAPPETELEERRRRWPPGMVRPSPVQYHATVMVTVALVLVGLAVFAFLNHRGVGPFKASQVRLERRAAGSIGVTFVVTNQGGRAARSTCRITAVDDTGAALADESFLTGQIAGHATVTVHHVMEAPSPPARLQVRCS
jgi:hypothetical protein